MFKETIISIIIVISIFSIDIFTQKYTNKAVSEVTTTFSELKTGLLNKNQDDIKNKVNEVDEKWSSVHDKLAYYIEHDELEKFDTAIIQAKSFVKNDDVSSAIAELETGKFVLEHIERKYKFNLQNIF